MMSRKTKSKGTFAAAAIPAGVALNVVANTIIKATGLPLYLNNIGTIFNTIVLGPILGMLTALLTNVVISLTTTWVYFAYTMVGMVVGLAAFGFFKKGYLKSMKGIIICGAIIGVIATTMSAVVTAFFFGGAQQGLAAVLVAGLIATGQSVFSASFIATLPGEIVDKIIALWAAVQILKMMPNRLLPNADYIKTQLEPRKNDN